MERNPITTSCLAVSSAVARTASALHRFVRLVRESRVDVIALSAELHALGGVLELLEDAADDVDASSSLPRDIAQQTPAVVTACGLLVHSLEQLFVDDSKTQPPPDGPPSHPHPHDPPSSLDADSRARWTAMRKQAAELRPGLEVYRLALGLALDLVALTSQTPDAASPPPHAEIALILAEISHLRLRVGSAACVDSDAAFALQNYLHVLQRHASASLYGQGQDQEAVYPHDVFVKAAPASRQSSRRRPATAATPTTIPFNAAVAPPARSRSRPTPVITPAVQSPDSAVDMCSGPALPPMLHKSRSAPPESPKRHPRSQLPAAWLDVENSPDDDTDVDDPVPIPVVSPMAATFGTVSATANATTTTTTSSTTTTSTPHLRLDLPIQELDQLLEEFRDRVPSQPPTPPPRSADRPQGPSLLSQQRPQTANPYVRQHRHYRSVSSAGTDETDTAPPPIARTRGRVPPPRVEVHLARPLSGDSSSGDSMASSFGRVAGRPSGRSRGGGSGSGSGSSSGSGSGGSRDQNRPAPEFSMPDAAVIDSRAPSVDNSVAYSVTDSKLSTRNTLPRSSHGGVGVREGRSGGNRFSRLFFRKRANSGSAISSPTTPTTPRTPTTPTGLLTLMMPTIPAREVVSPISPISPISPGKLAPSSTVGSRSSSRLSASLQLMVPWARRNTADEDEDEDEDEYADGPPASAGVGAAAAAAAAAAMGLTDAADGVFGVSLRKSIQVAGTAARTRHAGSRGATVRQFPVCMMTCYRFLVDQGGVETVDIFGNHGNSTSSTGAVRRLRTAFAAPPDYGASLDLAAGGYSAHDAAALMLHYLERLRRPLVTEAVVRRWVTLSRQATQAGGGGDGRQARLDEGIDFWAEALEGVGGGSREATQAARNLVKLLLNLWGDVADAADRNDMTAERLAGCVLRPLVHARLADSRHRTDYVLALAFVIRRRSEYAQLLHGSGRKSHAAFVA